MHRHVLPLLALVALASCQRRQPLPYSGFLDTTISAVASQVPGKVESIPVREGDLVRKGQPLAHLDSRERDALVAQAEANLAHNQQMLVEAEANLKATLPTVKGAGADIARAQAALQQAQDDYERTRRLKRGGAATHADLDAAEARYRQAQAALRGLLASKDVASGRVQAAIAAVDSARAAVHIAETALDLANVQRAQADILAPFDGRVVQRNVDEGAWVATGTPVVTIEDTAHLWVRLDVEETQLSFLQLGAPATVTVVAVPGRTFAGHVIEIGPEGTFAVNRDVKRGRPDIRTFLVRVGLDELSGELRPGMTAEVRFRPGQAPDGGRGQVAEEP